MSDVPNNDGWHWWASESQDGIASVGPLPTREAAIAEAEGQRLGENEDDAGAYHLDFWVFEATNGPLRLADWIAADCALENADERLADSDRISTEFDDGPWFEATPEQERDLRDRLKRTCDEWQSAHGLVFTCSTFSDSRSYERVQIGRDTEEPSDG